MSKTAEIPCWNLDDVFHGFESEEYKKAKNELKTLLENLGIELENAKPPSDIKSTANWLFELRQVGSARDACRYTICLCPGTF